MATAAGPRRGAFISYARADGEAAARRLHARLAAEVPEVPAWLDRLEIEGGVGWWRQIEAQLDRAAFLLIVMTPAALASAHTRQEWRAARQRGVCVYPVKGVPDAQLDDAVLPRWMAAAHFYDPHREWPSLVPAGDRRCLERLPRRAFPRCCRRLRAAGDDAAARGGYRRAARRHRPHGRGAGAADAPG